MKNFIKLALVLLAVTAVFSACGRNSGYKDDVAVSDLSDIAESVISGSEGLDDVGENYINAIIKLSDSQYSECTVKMNTIGLNINEYGIFCSENAEAAEEVEAIVKDYLQMRNDTWMSAYLPEEYPKLQNAEVKVFGNYLVYLILDSNEKAQVFSEIEAALKP